MNVGTQVLFTVGSVLRGQSYTLGNRQLTRANLAEIHKVIKELESELEQMAGRSRGFSKRVVFHD